MVQRTESGGKRLINGGEWTDKFGRTDSMGLRTEYAVQRKETSGARPINGGDGQIK
ncbi:hypothetical protein [Bacillus sp. SJS]|uniref:hypothetical protein n=1 Tax=Bacillus sp. SJS TaxID=1423321 RepID=UPI0012E7E6E9|nr:hypothetical protein [Bacillus sp. SJS]